MKANSSQKCFNECGSFQNFWHFRLRLPFVFRNCILLRLLDLLVGCLRPGLPSRFIRYIPQKRLQFALICADFSRSSASHEPSRRQAEPALLFGRPW